MLIPFSSMFVQAMLWLHLKFMAVFVIDVPWTPAYEMSLTLTADVFSIINEDSEVK